MITENEIAKILFDLSLKVHKKPGPGLLESAYQECFYFEIIEAGSRAEKQKTLPLIYEEIMPDAGYRIDLMIESKFIIKAKPVEALADIHLAQILTNLKLSNCRLRLLINFNTVLFKDGVKQVIHGTLN